MADRNVRIITSDAIDHRAPQLGHFEHVGLVDRGQPPPSPPSHLEGDARDPLHFELRVDQGVHGPIRPGFSASRRAVVDAARKLAHDDEVGAHGHFWLERQNTDQLLVDLGGSQVGKAAQLAAQLKQRCLRALLG